MPSGQYLIAMCDVLGFTNLVAATPLGWGPHRFGGTRGAGGKGEVAQRAPLLWNRRRQPERAPV